MKRNLYVGATILALAAALGVGSAVIGRKATVQAAGVQAPRFEVDPLWPRPLPNHWVQGQTIGLDVDSHDNVWIIHRPGTFDSSGKETYAMTNPPSADCCVAAPDVLEFNAAGDLIGHWRARHEAMTGRLRTTASRSIRPMAPSGLAQTAVVRTRRLPVPQQLPDAEPAAVRLAAARTLLLQLPGGTPQAARRVSRQLHPGLHARRQVAGRNRRREHEQGQQRPERPSRRG